MKENILKLVSKNFFYNEENILMKKCYKKLIYVKTSELMKLKINYIVSLTLGRIDIYYKHKIKIGHI